MSPDSKQAMRLPKDPTIYALGNVLRRLVGFVMLPIYTRYLTPADYGVVGLLTFAMAIMEPLFGARLSEAMPKYYFECGEEKGGKSVISTALVVTGSVSAVTAVIAFLLRAYSSQALFGTKAYALEVGWFGVQVLSQPIEYYGMTYLRILRRPWTFLGVSLSKLVIQLSLNIVLVVWLRLGVMGVVISSVVSSFLFAFGLCIYTLLQVGVGFDAQLAKTMLAFSWPLWLTSISGLYIYQGGAYFLRVFGSLGEVGLYELATRVAAVLGFLVWNPFNQYWEAVRYKYHRNPEDRGIYAKVFHTMTVLLFAAALCLTLGAEPVIRLMAAPAFQGASVVVPILVVSSCLGALAGFVRFGLLVGDKTLWVTLIGYLTAGAVTILNVALIPRLGMIGVALALVGARLVQFVVTFALSRRRFDMGINLKPIFALFAILGGASISADLLPQNPNFVVDCAQRGAILLVALAPLAVMFWRMPFARAQFEPLLCRVRSRIFG